MPSAAVSASADAADAAATRLLAPGVAAPASLSDPARAALIAAVDDLLPQTQCERCGHPGCLPYARAVVDGESIGRCAPGGRQTIAVLADLLGRPAVEPDADCPPVDRRLTAVIDEATCIGCVKCVIACPVDAIVGLPKHRHRVLAERCTGCERCLPPCPVDCIRMEPLASAWTAVDARSARRRYQQTTQRRAQAAVEAEPVDGHRAGALDILSRPEERARRLAAILQAAGQQRPQATPPSDRS